MIGVLDAAPSIHLNVNGFERYVWNHYGTRLMIAMLRDGEACTHYNGFALGFKITSIAQLHQALDAALAPLRRGRGRCSGLEQSAGQ